VTHLSPREREIVEMLGRDLSSYKTVGSRLRISVHTVRAYVRRIVERHDLRDQPAKTAMIDLYRRELVSTTADSTSGDF
jgi:DNA-binding NarL/FixJ family response regulator